MSLMSFLVSLVVWLFFQIAVSGREGLVLSSFCLSFFYFSFLGGMVILIPLWVGWRIHLLLARVWHTFLFWGLIVVLWDLGGLKIIYYCIYPECIFLLIICNFYMFFTFVLVYVSVFVCLFVHQCVVVQLSVSYADLNVSLWGL